MTAFFDSKDLKEATASIKKLSSKMKNYRLPYYNYLKRELDRYFFMLRSVARMNVPVDTGTLKRRTDYKQVKWNTYYIGHFEPQDRYSGEPATSLNGVDLYDPTKHKHTQNSQLFKKYARYNIAPNHWGTMPYNTVIDLLSKEIERLTDDFNKRYFD
jgi:hypothetical protein